MDKHSMMKILVGEQRALVGMVHVQALPGTPAACMEMERRVDQAVQEARIYREAGFNALMIENMHDRPYLKRTVGPEITAAMAVVGREIKRAVDLPLGVQVLAGANKEALAVALACGAQFIRAEGFVFAHVADEGVIESDAGELLRYRRNVGASHIKVFADIKKKHSAHTLTADVDIAQTAHAAEFFMVDGVLVTGAATGQPASVVETQQVCAAVQIPTWVGSGITPDNLLQFREADGFVVGSFVKQDGHWANPLDPARVRAMAQSFRALT